MVLKNYIIQINKCINLLLQKFLDYFINGRQIINWPVRGKVQTGLPLLLRGMILATFNFLDHEYCFLYL